MSGRKVIYVTNIAPHYRNRLWLLLAGQSDSFWSFFFGKQSVKNNSSVIKEIDFSDEAWKDYKDRIHNIINIRYRGIIYFQQGIIMNTVKSEYDVIVLLGQVHILSNWIVALISRVKGKRIVMWGHGLSGKEKRLNRFIKLLYYRLADIHLVYGENGKTQMVSNGVDENKVEVVYNSLDYDQHLSLRRDAIDASFYESLNVFKKPQLPVLVYIGRLTPEKKLDQLIQALLKLRDEGIQLNLTIIGEGSEIERLKIAAESLKGYIYFHGASYDEKMNSKFIANADLCVSPGNIGLTAIHSLSYGTPVCTHSDISWQGPEVEAVQDGVTGTFFKRDSKEDLARKIKNWIMKNGAEREEIRRNCYKIVDEYYNPYRQLEIFRKAINS